MRILIPVFSTPHPEAGGITRLIALADRCLEEEHELLFIASGYQETVLKGKGYAVHSMPIPTFFGLPKWISHPFERKSQTTSIQLPMNNMWFLFFLAGLTQKTFLKTLLSKSLEIATSFKPQAILTDYSPVAFLLSKILNLPIACTYSSIYSAGQGSFLYNRYQRIVKDILNKHNTPLTTLENLFFGPSVLKIIPNIPEFDDADAHSPDICYVGSLLTEKNKSQKIDHTFPFDKSKRYVFVYMGTGSISLKLIKKVLP